MPTFLNVKNNASSILASNITAGATSLTVAAGEGARFPATDFHITIDNEIMKCTTRSADVLTVTRAQEGTTAAAHSAGAAVKLNITAKIISELQEALKECSARAYLGSTQTIEPGTYYKVALGTENWDTQNEWDTGTYRYVASKAGKCFVVLSVDWEGANQPAAGDKFQLVLRKNGSNLIVYESIAPAAGPFMQKFSDIVSLNATDYLEMWVYCWAAATRYLYAVTNYTYMVAHMLP